MSHAARGSALKLVPGPSWSEEQHPQELVTFCSHCGVHSSMPAASNRVCGDCGFGVMLEAGFSVAPSEAAAFLVTDRAMSICAVSRGAEKLLEISEIHAIHRHLTEYLLPAEAEVVDRGGLAFAISSAVGGAAVEERFMLRPANLFGVRLNVRVVTCGPRPGALILLD